MHKKSPFQKRCLTLGITLMLGAAILQVIGCSTLHRYEWTKQDKIAAGVMLAGRAADMISTHYALEHGAREVNPFLGEHPSDLELAAWGVGTAAIMLVLADFVPPKLRQILLYGAGALSGAVAVHNFYIAMN